MSLLPRSIWFPLLCCIIFLTACTEDPPALTEAPAAPPPRVTQVEGVVVRSMPLDQRLSATGTFIPNEQVELTTEVAGKIRELNFCEGCPVRKGQLIARLDQSDLRARLAKTDVDLELAEEELVRSQKLQAIKAVPEEEVIRARSRTESLKADQSIQQVQLSKTSIRAPFSGRAGLRQVSIGSYVNPGMSITTIRQIDPIKIEFGVPERFASHIQKDTRVWFTTSNGMDTLEAKVYAVDPAIDPATRAFKVRALATNPDNQLIPGGFTNVYYQVYQNQNTFNIPAEAVLPVLDGQKVLVKKDGKVLSKKVRIGIRNEDKVQILEGIADGDTVLTTGLLILTDGMLVGVK